MASSNCNGFDLKPGRRLAGKYVVGEMLGKGWEGEVYHVTEIATRVERAAKFFFPQRNLDNRAITFYARKLEKLRHCQILIQYHTQESFQHRGERVTFLVSDYVRGELLSDYLARQRGKRLTPFEAMHLLRALAEGIAPIHAARDYHGDLHSDNVIVKRRGLGFDAKLLDMFEWGRATAVHMEDDVCDLVRLFYDAVGGQRHYARQPAQVKDICCGLKRSLIRRKFRTAQQLVTYLDGLHWD